MITALGSSLSAGPKPSGSVLAVGAFGWRLLNHRYLRDCRSLQLPFGFLLAFLVGRALACRDFVERAPLGFHPHVGVARQHGARDVPGDAHDDFIARARLGEFRDQGVAVRGAAARRTATHSTNRSDG